MPPHNLESYVDYARSAITQDIVLVVSYQGKEPKLEWDRILDSLKEGYQRRSSVPIMLLPQAPDAILSHCVVRAIGLSQPRCDFTSREEAIGFLAEKARATFIEIKRAWRNNPSLRWPEPMSS